MNPKSIPKKDVKTIPSLGVEELWQSLFLLPSEYVDYSSAVTHFRDIPFDAKDILIKAKVTGKKYFSRKREPRSEDSAEVIMLTLSDGTTVMECDIFNVREWKGIEVGNSITAMVSLKQNHFRGQYFTTPRRATVTPYPGVEYLGVAGKVAGVLIKKIISSAIKTENTFDQAAVWLQSHRPMLHKLIVTHWGKTSDLLKALHSPLTLKEGLSALAFAKRLCVAEVRYNGRLSALRAEAIEPFPDLRQLTWEALKAQPETASEGQLNALKVAMPHLCDAKPTRILLNGDVGSGKTLVFLCIAAGFAKADKAVAIMAPNENVAKQIFRQFQRRFPDILAQYVGGGKKKINLEARVYIGTTALTFMKERPNFSLVIIDEQHKYSREQRECLLSKETHLIEATATPIPRSLAIALYDGCVLAQIPTPPVSRQISSHIIYADQRSKIREMHRCAIDSGKRVIYLYSAVQDKKKNNPPDDNGEVAPGRLKLKTTNDTYEDMIKAFPDKVSLVHGQMSAERSASELEAFRDGTKPILIASTAIEVGVDVPGIALVVVSNPERFGTSQLHQIRGRLARDGGSADFVMHVMNDPGKDALLRLDAVKSTSDGYKLAERDLELRGFGDVAGDLQTGATNTTFKLSQIGATDFLTPVRKRPFNG